MCRSRLDYQRAPPPRRYPRSRRRRAPVALNISRFLPPSISSPLPILRCVFTAAGAAPDKPAGVVAITFTDLRRRGKIGKMVLVDAVGERMPAVRDTMAQKIGAAYKDMDLTMTTLPADDVKFDPQSFREAIKLMERGDVVTIFTPDDTHFEIALACIEAGLHVLCAKPVVKKLEDHLKLAEAAKKQGVLCAIEYHKRFDPIYTDARDRIRHQLGRGGRWLPFRSPLVGLFFSFFPFFITNHNKVLFYTAPTTLPR